MVFKEVVSELPELWTPENDGDFIEGYYRKKKDKVGVNKSTMYMIEIKEGEVKSIWGSAVLDDKMSYIDEGELIRITYLESDKNYKMFKVERDVSE
jgi:hypothetical protein